MKNYKYLNINKSLEKFFIHAIPLIIAIMIILPYLYVILVSLKGPVYELLSDPKWLLPKNPTISSYINAFKNTDVMIWIRNSFIVSIVATGITVILHSTAAFAFYRNRFNKIVNIIFILTLIGIMIPRAVTLIPLFKIMLNFKLINNYFGIILPSLALPFGVFIVRQALFSFPIELLDAAKIDGCSEITSFLRIVFPILSPILVVLAIYTFVTVWGDFIWQVIIITSPKMQTIPVGLTMWLGDQGRLDQGLYMTNVMITLIPSIIVFLLFQRYFIKGLTLGALKE